MTGFIKTTQPPLHGDQHLPDGSDPIPGLPPEPGGSFTDWVLALPGLWAYWPLQEAAGDAIDQGPAHADMQPVGTPAYRVTGPNSSDLQYAVRLTGTTASSISDDSFYNTADQLDMDAHVEFTAMVWIKPDSGASSSARLPVIGTWDTFRTGWTLYLMETTRQLNFTAGNGTTTGFVIGPAISMGEWTFVTVTRDDTATVRLYVNGSEVESGTVATLVGNGHGIRLGAADFASVDPDSYFFYGDMAGAVWVDHALTGGEILQAFESLASVTEGWILVIGPDGKPIWQPPPEPPEPTPPPTVGGGGVGPPPDDTPGVDPDPPDPGGPTSPAGWDEALHEETVVLYDSSPGRFDVPTRKWVRVPFNTVRILRSWQIDPDDDLVNQAWLPDDRDLTAQAREGVLHINADMAGTQTISGFYAIEYPILDYLGLPDDDPEVDGYGPRPSEPLDMGPIAYDAYLRSARILNVSNGRVLRVTPGSSVRRFIQWDFSMDADERVIEWGYESDNPYPIYPNNWPNRPLKMPAPYPKLTEPSSVTYYISAFGIPGFIANNLQVEATLAAGANICLQAWQDSPWTLRFSTDHYPGVTPGEHTIYSDRPHLAMTYLYDPDTVDHTTGKLLY